MSPAHSKAVALACLALLMVLAAPAAGAVRRLAGATDAQSADTQGAPGYPNPFQLEPVRKEPVFTARRQSALAFTARARANPKAAFEDWKRANHRVYPTKQAEEAAFKAWRARVEKVHTTNALASTWTARVGAKADFVPTVNRKTPYATGLRPEGLGFGRAKPRRRVAREEVDELVERNPPNLQQLLDEVVVVGGADKAAKEHGAAEDKAANSRRRLQQGGATCAWRNWEANKTAYSYSWRAYASPIQDQGDCGSCVAFSVAGAAEIQFRQKGGRVTKLSEQQILDCAAPYRTAPNGCDGAMPSEYLSYMQDNGGGLTSSSYYPYASGWSVVTNQCKRTDERRSVSGGMTGFVSLYGEAAMMDALCSGPITVGLSIVDSFYSYESGVFKPRSCPRTIEECTYENGCQGLHAVVVVGFGTTAQGVPYWLVRNSWGTSWGEDGYAKIFRGQDICGIETMFVNQMVMAPSHPMYQDVMLTGTQKVGSVYAKSQQPTSVACSTQCAGSALCQAWSYDATTRVCSLASDNYLDAVRNSTTAGTIMGSRGSGLRIAVKPAAPWGTPRKFVTCPHGQNVVGFRTRVQEPCTNCDRTGVNSVRLLCRNAAGTQQTELVSHDGYTGAWSAWQICPNGAYLYAAKLKVQSSLGRRGDNTAVTDVAFRCRSAATKLAVGNPLTAPNAAAGGTWPPYYTACPARHVICGYSNAIHTDRGTAGDDTALNGMSLKCCPLP